VHLVGFIIRIYHDARSSECQIPQGLTDCHILSACALCLKPFMLREKLCYSRWTNQKLSHYNTHNTCTNMTNCILPPHCVFMSRGRTRNHV